MSLFLNDPVMLKFVNYLMKDGKRVKALKIVDEAFFILKREHGVDNPHEFFRKAVDNAKPLIETKAHYVSGRRHEVPRPCTPQRQQILALRHIKQAVQEARNERGAHVRLAKELVDLSNLTGYARQKRDELHKTAEANRAYSHLR